MTDFKIYSAALSDAEKNLLKIASELSDKKDEIRSVCARLDFRISATSSIRLKLNRIANNAEACSSKSRKMANAATQISNKYIKNEERICNNATGEGGIWEIGRGVIDKVVFPPPINIPKIIDNMDIFDNISETFPEIAQILSPVGFAEVISKISNWHNNLPDDSKFVVDTLAKQGLLGMIIVGTTGVGSERKSGINSSGDFLNADGKMDLEKNFDWQNGDVGVSASAEGEAHIFSGSIGASGEYISADANVNVGNVAGEGEIDCTLFKDGELSPEISLSGSVEASVVEGDFNVVAGTEDANVFVDGEGKLLAAEASGEAAIGKIIETDDDGNTTVEYGVKAEVEAEAYVAEGTVSCGFEFLGIEIGLDFTGKVGGAGVTAGGSATTGGCEGNIGLGLGAGAEIGFSIEWDDFKWPWE